MDYNPYNIKLEDIQFGHLFMMLNYQGVFMRVKAHKELQICHEARYSKLSNFNEDSVGHVPILNMATSEITWMHKTKPCCTPCLRW